jgi:hypothetical protein
MADRTHEDEDTLTQDMSTPRRQGDPKSVNAPVTEGRSPDEFISSEVNEKTSRPMHPEKTRG